MVSIQVATSNHEIRLFGEPRMIRDRESPAYVLVAPVMATQVRGKSSIGVISVDDWSIRPMLWISLAYGSKSEDDRSTAQGGVATNFERLRETKDLSALAHT
jgi:hypothetical protein